MVGLGGRDDEYIPMMWKTLRAPYDGEPWFDFKYINGRSVWGLNKSAVFGRDDLAQLFRLYCEKTGDTQFP